ncbi:DEAD-box ATP-dependent RNA helicase 42, partial [Ophiophagus hannah]
SSSPTHTSHPHPSRRPYTISDPRQSRFKKSTKLTPASLKNGANNSTEQISPSAAELLGSSLGVVRRGPYLPSILNRCKPRTPSACKASSQEFFQLLALFPTAAKLGARRPRNMGLLLEQGPLSWHTCKPPSICQEHQLVTASSWPGSQGTRTNKAGFQGPRGTFRRTRPVVFLTGGLEEETGQPLARIPQVGAFNSQDPSASEACGLQLPELKRMKLKRRDCRGRDRKRLSIAGWGILGVEGREGGRKEKRKDEKKKEEGRDDEGRKEGGREKKERRWSEKEGREIRRRRRRRRGRMRKEGRKEGKKKEEGRDKEGRRKRNEDGRIRRGRMMKEGRKKEGRRKDKERRNGEGRKEGKKRR